MPYNSEYQEPDTSVDSTPDFHDDAHSQMSVFDLAVMLAKHKKLILLLPFVTAVLVALYSLTLPNIYTATAKMLPPQQGQSAASAMLAQLGNLGFGGLGGAKNAGELYVSMLQSRRVADGLIARFDLNNVYKQKLQSQTRVALAGHTNIMGGKEGIITISFDDEDSKRAAAIANGYVDELRKLTSVLAVTEASQRRLFFEQQLGMAREQLSKTEVAAKQALEKGGLAQVEGQARALLESTARLRGQITVKEVQIGAMRTFAAEGNPELNLAQQELESMKRELAKIESGGRGATGERGRDGTGIDNVRLLRDLKYYETIYELLAKQYEIARIDEAKDPSMIQVLDNAIEPDQRSRPKRSLLALLAAAAALLVAVVWALVVELLRRLRDDPRKMQQVQTFKRYLAWR